MRSSREGPLRSSFLSSIARAFKSESGNVFFTLFGAVALVGAVGAASMQVLKGPVRAMSEVTKRTVAENSMIASTKLAIIGAAGQANPPGLYNADCDADGYVEPIDPADPGADANFPPGGGFQPADIGAAQNDPWNTRYGYCGWDHGNDIGKCGGGKTRLRAGAEVEDEYAIVVISAGPNHVFETTCHDFVDTTPADGNADTPLITKGAGSDDIVMGYTYAEANNIGGGLWTLKEGDDTKATLNKDIEVLGGAGGTETVFGLNRTTGDAEFMAIKTDNIYAKSTNSTIEFGDIFRVKGYEDLAPPLGGGGGGGLPTCGDGEILQYDLGDTEWDCVATTSLTITEADPQVGTLTNTRWCTTNGTVIDCTTVAPVLTETDPQVGAVTNNQWCRGDGSAVVCDQAAPGGGTLSCHGGNNPQTYDGRCYTTFTSRDLYGAATFGTSQIDDMRGICQAWGGDGLIINDSAEQAFITSNYASGQGWLAMTDNGSYGSSEGSPRWYDGTMPYTNFNASTNQSSGRDAVRMNSDGTWRYENYNTDRDFYCESTNAFSSAYAQDGKTCSSGAYMEGETNLGCAVSYACINGV